MSNKTGFSYLCSQWRSVLVCIFCTMAAFNFGYDTSYFSGILSMPVFIKNFGGVLDPKTGKLGLTASRQSLVTSIIQVGELLGAASAWFIADKVGRKGGLYVTSTCVVIGTTLQICSNMVGTLIAGRIVVGYAIGVISCLVPLYIADCAPARLRGALTTLYQFAIGCGLLMGVVVDMQTSKRNDTGSYRISMAMQYLFPLLLVPGLVFWMPESPRWLIENNKVAKAERSLQTLKGPRQEDEVAAEMAYLQASNDAYQPTSWSSIWKNKAELRKAYLGFAIQALQQSSGINFITGYGIVFFFNLNIENVYLISIGLYTVGFPATWISQYCIEKYGRRPILILSGILMAATLFIMAGAGVATTATNTKSTSSVIVAMVFTFIFVFSLGWGPTVWVVTAEISTGSNRGKLMTISTVSNWFFDWLVSFTFPYLDNPDAGNLGAKIGFIYGTLMLAACVWVYFYLPETAGRSIEEIHQLFELGVPARQFKGYTLPSREDVVDGKLGEKEAGVATYTEVTA